MFVIRMDVSRAVTRIWIAETYNHDGGMIGESVCSVKDVRASRFGVLVSERAHSSSAFIHGFWDHTKLIIFAGKSQPVPIVNMMLNTMQSCMIQVRIFNDSCYKRH